MNMKKRSIALALAGILMCSSVFAGYSVKAEAAEEDNYVTEEQLSDNKTAAPTSDEVVPDANQYRYQKEEISAFCHFGPNTFNEIEWGQNYGDRAPSEIFTLTEDFDAETLVKTLKEAGFEKLIVTAKHHDGFCIWDSKWTEYDVAATNYRDANGQSDILAEISAACTEYDMDMGLYLSPWDIHDPSYGYFTENGTAITTVAGRTEDALDYNDYYNNQLEEILGNDKYGNDGHFNEVWMDGANGSESGLQYAQEYDFIRWFNTIQKYEGKEAGYDADCMLFGAEAYTTVRWIGNENGYAAEETWSKSIVDKTQNTIDSNRSGEFFKGHENGNQWTVPEVDARITSGWFWGTTKCTPKSITDLGNMYFGSVGHNGVLLLNVPPNNQGTVDQAILDRVEEFGNEIKATFDENLAADATISASEVRGYDVAYKPSNVIDGKDDTYWTTNDGTTEGSLLVDLGSVQTFDVVSIEESIEFGQRITSFKVEYRNTEDSDAWKTFDEGTTVGGKRLSRKGAVRADQIKITVSTASQVIENENVPMISEVGVYKASDNFEILGTAPEGMDIIDITDFTLAGGWTQESGSQYINNTNAWANGNSNGNVTATVEFTGTKVYLLGTVDSGHGEADIYIDNNLVGSIDTQRSPRAVGQVLYESGTLSDGEHTIKLVATESGKAIGLEAAYVINNGGLGMVGIEHASYTMNEDSEMQVKLVRVGGSTGKVTVRMEPNAGSAVQGDYVTEMIETVTFEEGETEKWATVITRRNERTTGEQYFTVELTALTDDLILGYNTKARIIIVDQEGLNPDLANYAMQPISSDKIEEATTNSEETTYGEIIGKAFDGDTTTFWHANYSAGKLVDNPTTGIYVDITLKEETTIGKLTYIPRLNPPNTGTIGNYEIYAATELGADDMPNYGSTPIEGGTGTFINVGSSTTPQEAVFQTPVRAKYIRLKAKTMAGGDHPTATEIGLYEAVAVTPTTYTVSATADNGGAVVPMTGALEADGTIEIVENKLKTFKFVPAEGYAIKNVTVTYAGGEDIPVGPVNHYTVAVTADVSIAAEFEFLANYQAVNEAFAEVEELDRSLYTKESLKAVDAAVAAVVTGQGVSQQEAVTAYAAAITRAIADLEALADYSDVDEAIAEARGLDRNKYTQESLAAVDAAVTAVERGKGESQQETVDGYATAIYRALDALEVRADYVDKSTLQSAYNTNKQKQNENYTDASWNAFQKALNDAKTILANENATQDQVDSAVQALNTAYGGLTKKDTTPASGGNTSSGDKTSSGNKTQSSTSSSTDTSKSSGTTLVGVAPAPTAQTTTTPTATGDSADTALLFAAAMFAAVVLLVVEKRKRNTI